MQLFAIFIYLFLPAVGSAPCRGNMPVSTQAQQGKVAAGSVTAYASLIEKLRAAGVSVELAGEVEQPFLSVTGTMIKVYGEDVQVFEYANPAVMEAETAKISRDGSSVGTSKLQWIGSPHFYRRGKILVLYLGDNERVLETLKRVVGKQFAGK